MSFLKGVDPSTSDAMESMLPFKPSSSKGNESNIAGSEGLIDTRTTATPPTSSISVPTSNSTPNDLSRLDYDYLILQATVNSSNELKSINDIADMTRTYAINIKDCMMSLLRWIRLMVLLCTLILGILVFNQFKKYTKKGNFGNNLNIGD
jgi:hypothetical protein